MSDLTSTPIDIQPNADDGTCSRFCEHAEDYGLDCACDHPEVDRDMSYVDTCPVAHQRLREEVEGLRADRNLLNWLDESAFGLALIHDDEEAWAVSGAGVQNIRDGGPLQTTFFIEPEDFHPTAREALRDAMQYWEANDE